IKLEEYENDFIGKTIDTNDFIRKHLSDHLEDIILKRFAKYIEDNHILELPPTIETTF
ncbi:XRE family transcriptional regulator, partial [Staphylococcus pseudintermedius]|nr:XRE family transcriptional regulator [Staphylococcus pseudintermedius]